jgi:hypothetical protein
MGKADYLRFRRHSEGVLCIEEKQPKQVYLVIRGGEGFYTQHEELPVFLGIVVIW